MVVENVKGAQKWVGRARWHYGSYYLWGDVPALMPIIVRRQVMKHGVTYRSNGATNFHGPQERRGSWFRVAHNTASGKGQNPDGRLLRNDPRDNVLQHTPHMTNPSEHGVKVGGDWFRDPIASASSKSSKRKFASALIAKIPLELSRYIARVYKPQAVAA